MMGFADAELLNRSGSPQPCFTLAQLLFRVLPAFGRSSITAFVVVAEGTPRKYHKI